MPADSARWLAPAGPPLAAVVEGSAGASGGSGGADRGGDREAREPALVADEGSRDRSPSRAALRQRPGAFRALYDEPRVYRFLSARAEFRQKSSSGPAMGDTSGSSVGRTQVFPTLPRARRWEGRRARAFAGAFAVLLLACAALARADARGRALHAFPPGGPSSRPPPARRRAAPSAPSSVGSTRTATDRSRRTSSRRTSGTPWAARTSTPRGRSARRWWA